MGSRRMIGFGTVCCVVIAVALAVPALAADPAPANYLELMRSDIRTEKVEILTEALNLNEQQAAAFWPIYKQYDAELALLGDRRVALVKRFVAGYGKMTNEDAGVFAKDWFAIQKDRLKLREKYFGKIAKATSNLVAARFVGLAWMAPNWQIREVRSRFEPHTAAVQSVPATRGHTHDATETEEATTKGKAAVGKHKNGGRRVAWTGDQVRRRVDRGN